MNYLSTPRPPRLAQGPACQGPLVKPPSMRIPAGSLPHDGHRALRRTTVKLTHPPNAPGPSWRPRPTRPRASTLVEENPAARAPGQLNGRPIAPAAGDLDETSWCSVHHLGAGPARALLAEGREPKRGDGREAPVAAGLADWVCESKI